jgi:L-threonylcarbamoyladenylate synthase
MDKDLLSAKKLLESGELVAIPTETVYGLAGNAFDEKAVLKIFQTKNRPVFDPLIVHCANVEQLKKCATEFPEWAQTLSQLMPCPLTILLKKSPLISDLVTSGSERVALRIPNHPLTLRLLSLLSFPLAAPSANPFGYISPTTAEHVKAQLGDKIPLILDGGACAVGLESTIVGEEDGSITVYRKGGFPTEKLEEIFGKINVIQTSSSNPKAPGMLSSHYAPKVAFALGNPLNYLKDCDIERMGFIAFREYSDAIPKENQLILSPNGDTDEAAMHLFDYMRKMDRTDFDLVVAELVPEKGLGIAVNDRLRRAAFKGDEGEKRNELKCS